MVLKSRVGVFLVFPLLIFLATRCVVPVVGVWMGRTETQCAEQWEASPHIRGTQRNARAYFKDVGIEVYEIRILEDPDSSLSFFTSCTCATGRKIFVRVHGNEADRMKLLGYK